MDDRRGNVIRAVLNTPPAAHKFRLVYQVNDHPAAQQCEQPVAVLSAQEMPRTGRNAPVHPVDPIQPLDDANTPSLLAQQPGQTPGGAGEQHRVVGHLVQVMADLDATRLARPWAILALEGTHTACIGCSREMQIRDT